MRKQNQRRSSTIWC